MNTEPQLNIVMDVKMKLKKHRGSSNVMMPQTILMKLNLILMFVTTAMLMGNSFTSLMRMLTTYI